MRFNFTQPKVIILCGGEGKRMGKITKKIPKPLIKIGNRSIIEHKLNYYKKQGLKNFVFCKTHPKKRYKNVIFCVFK